MKQYEEMPYNQLMVAWHCLLLKKQPEELNSGKTSGYILLKIVAQIDTPVAAGLGPAVNPCIAGNINPCYT